MLNLSTLITMLNLSTLTTIDGIQVAIPVIPATTSTITTQNLQIPSLLTLVLSHTARYHTAAARLYACRLHLDHQVHLSGLALRL
jgi:hypothetical protein